MTTIVKRTTKGSPLTHAEVDANFDNLNNNKLELSAGGQLFNGTSAYSGNLGLGMTPANELDVYGASSPRIAIRAPESISESIELGFQFGTGANASTNTLAMIRAVPTQVDPSPLRADLLFLTNSGDNAAERLRIDASGNLIVGANSLGGWVSRAKIKQGNTTKTGGVAIEASSNTAGINIGHTGTAGYIGSNYGSAGDSYTPLIFQTGDLDRLAIDTSGNVGIGTITPATFGKFAVTGTNGTFSVGTNGDVIQFSKAGSNIVSASAVGGYFDFQVNGGAQALRIDASGNVGIGTTSPLAALHVAGSSARLQNAAGTDTAFSVVNSVGSTILGTDNVSSYILAGSARPLSFYTNAAERMRIDASGNVLSTGGGGLGYGTGSGGTVTQTTSKITAVTLNKPSGRITMNNAALAAGASVQFYLNNSAIGASDVIVVNPYNNVNYTVQCIAIAAGSAYLRVTNISGGSLSEALELNFAIIKGATA